MILNTTKIGLTVLDRAFGGIYLHRPTLICGRNKSGKSIIATHLAMKTLLSGENLILFTDKSPDDFLLNADATKMNLSQAIAAGQLLLLPYSTMTRNGDSKYSPLPFPEALDELRELVKSRHVSYVIFDTVVPWLATLPVEKMPEHVDNIITAFNEMGLTTLLLLPEPASASSKKLAETLRELCPINMEIESRNFGAEFVLRVTKYQGGNRAKLPLEFSLDLVPGVGFEHVTANDVTSLKDSASDEKLTATRVPPESRTYKPFLSQSLADFSSTPAPQRPTNPAAFGQQMATRPSARPIPSVQPAQTRTTIKPIPAIQTAQPQPAARQPIPSASPMPPESQQPRRPIPSVQPQSVQPQSPFTAAHPANPNPADLRQPNQPIAQPSFANVMEYQSFSKSAQPSPNVTSNDGQSGQKNDDGSNGIKFSAIIR